MATLDEIRKKLQDSEPQFNKNGNNQSNSEVYPFWNIPDGSTATVRFLPDGDENNTLFWVERLIIKLPFEGIKGQHDKETIVQVPCVEMWDEACPVLTEVRPWFKDPELESMGRKYWKKRSYVFQGFVINDPMDGETPENPIRRFVINKSIFEIIKASLMDSEMEEIPVDYTAGRDFKLTKTKRGQYADYTTSSWSMRTRALDDEEIGAIDTNGLYDLKEYLPRKPDAKHLEIIKELFEASVNGEPYDEEKWGSYYRPYGMNKPANTSTAASTASTATTTETVTKAVTEEVEEKAAKPSAALAKLKAKAKEDVVEDTVEDASDDGDSKPDPKKILDMIKKRQNAS